MVNNFKCPNCKKEKFISKYKFIGDDKYYDLDDNVLKCCNISLEFIELTGNDIGYPAIGKFSSLSKKDKIQAFKNRAKEHFNKKIKEKKIYLDKQ